MAAKPGARGSVRINLESLVFAPILFLVMAGAAISGVVLIAWQASAGVGGPALTGGVVAVLFGAPLAFFAWKQWRFGANHLLVDVAGASVHLVTGKQATSCALDQLGALAVEPYKHRNAYGRYMQDRYRVPAPGLNVFLIDTASERAAVELHRRVDELVAQSAIRTLLGAAAVDAGAFRNLPDVAARVRAAVTDRRRLDAALAALQRDPDEHIRRVAAEIHATLPA